MRALWFWLAAVLIGAAAVVAYRRHHGRTSYVAVVARGNTLLVVGDFAGAAGQYENAERLAPESADIRLNLAIAYLRMGRNKEAIDEANAVLGLDRNNPAAFYIIGCAHMHLFEWDAAVRALQQSQAISPRVAAVSFQLGLAHEQLGQLDAAVHDFEATTLYDPSHAAGHFRLSRLYQKVGRPADAAVQMKLLQDLLAKPGAVQPTPTELEECLYTRPRAPFILGQPAVPGVRVRFVDATAEAFGAEAAKLRAPMAAIDYDSDGRNSLFAREQGGSFVLLDNRAGTFKPLGRPIAAGARAPYSQVLVGDIDNDGTPDVVVLGEEGSRLFRFRSGGKAVDYTSSAGIDGLRASSGLLADLDFTGNLDIVAVRPAGAGLQVYRNLGEFAFADATDELGVPADLPGTLSIDVEDWGNDGLPTLFVARKGAHPDFFSEHRATGFTKGNVSDAWPHAAVMAGGDLNNDLETDAVVAGPSGIDVLLSGRKEPVRLATGGFRVAGLLLSDFDNDGWLDIFAYGPDGIRLWRNEGHAGFSDVTEAAGLSSVGAVTGLVAADFSGKGAEDLVASMPSGLRFLRNEGAAANHLLRLRLKGTRSNASAIGARIELAAGDWRTSRTVHAVPIEFGTGAHAKLDAVTIHWTDATTANPGVEATPGGVAIVEPKIPTGSCPYLYAWDGRRFRFVSDVLGAAPLGLPKSLTSLVPSNPRELLSLGDERQFPARSGAYELRLTDELREILYLDEARLVVVDHPEGTLVCPTSKLLEGPPFPSPELWTLRPLRAPLKAFRSDGLDVTDELARADGRMAGPVATWRPQMRGYALPYSVTMDFGDLDTRRPLVLALTGWLQFGGGMANIAASFDPKVGPPFPRLEAQVPDGTWREVKTDVGAPCGKTKTILVDLDGSLPEGARRLRLTTSFEIYWDAALLCERVDAKGSEAVHEIDPARADLRWRGFSRYEPEVRGLPLVPNYDSVAGTPRWDFTPTGWCTRYGDVLPLVNAEDDRLAVLNGGDEVALSFPAAGLPRPEPGRTRDFFLYLCGWDKDADFHVRRGGEVAPLPRHGMDDQRFGSEPANGAASPAWAGEYDTRWVGPATLARQAAPSD